MSRSWQRVLWVSWTAQILAIVGFNIVTPFLPLYVQHLGVHDRSALLLWSGVLFAGTTVAMTLFAPLWGSVADRYGRKMMVVRAMGSGAVLVFLMTVVQNPQELLILRVVQGMLTGSVAASQALVAAAVPRERLGLAMGAMQTALFTGASIGPLVGGQLVVRVGFETTFVIAAALLAVAALLVAFFVEEQFTPGAVRHDEPRRSLLGDVRAILRQRQLALVIVVICAVQFGAQIVAPFLSVFVQDLGATPQNAAAQAGNVFSIAGICSALTAIAAGRFMDRRGRFRLVLIGTTLAAAMLNVPQAFTASINQLYVLRGLEGLAMGGMLATSTTMLSLGTPAEWRGATIGLSAGANAAGQALGQVSGSAIASSLGIRSVFLVTASVLALVSAAVALGVREPEPPDDEEEGCYHTHAPVGTVATPAGR